MILTDKQETIYTTDAEIIKNISPLHIGDIVYPNMYTLDHPNVEFGVVVGYSKERALWLIDYTARSGGKSYNVPGVTHGHFEYADDVNVVPLGCVLHKCINGHYHVQEQCVKCRLEYNTFKVDRDHIYNRAAQSDYSTEDLANLRGFGINLDLNLVHECARFYALHTLALRDSFYLNVKGRNDRRLADLFYKYSFMACGGELRHYSTQVAQEDVNKTLSWNEYCKVFSSNKTVFMNAGRVNAWGYWLKHPNFNEEELLRYCIQLFPQFVGGGFGGTSWAKIAQNALDFKMGRISAETFVDTSWGLHHNGNVFFDKVYNVEDPFLTVLEAGKYGRVGVIYQYLDDPELRRAFETVLGVAPTEDWPSCPPAGLKRNNKEADAPEPNESDSGEAKECDCPVCTKVKIAKEKKLVEYVTAYLAGEIVTRKGDGGTESPETLDVDFPLSKSIPLQNTPMPKSKFKPTKSNVFFEFNPAYFKFDNTAPSAPSEDVLPLPNPSESGPD